VTIIRGILCS